MKIMKFRSMVVLGSMGLLMFSCENLITDSTVSPEDSAAAVNAVNAANAELEVLITDMINTMDNLDSFNVDMIQSALDFSAAYNGYESALALDPNNTQANFGSAMTGLLQVTNNADFKDLVDRWETYFSDNIPFVSDLPTTTLGRRGYGMPTTIQGLPAMASMHILAAPLNFAKVATGDIPQMSELQAIIESDFIPIVSTSLQRLEVVEGDSNFVFTITGVMQGDTTASNLELDLTEVYTVDMALRVVNTLLRTAVAYNMDVATHDSAGMVNALNQSSDFLTLRTNGANNLQTAISDARTAITKAELALDFLEAETDDQSNDLITTSGNPADEIQDVRSTLSDIQEGLNGPIWVYWEVWHEEYSDGQWLEWTTTDSLHLNPSRLFEAPIQDLKSMLPVYSVSTGLDTLTSFTNEQIPIFFSTDSLIWPEYPNSPQNWGGNANISAYYYQDIYADDYSLSVNFYWNSVTVYVDRFEDLDFSGYPPPIEQLGNFLLEQIQQLQAQNNEYESLSFYWYGQMYIGQPFELSGSAYLEREYPDQLLTYPILTWDQDTYTAWKAAWPDPTFNGIFPDWDIEAFMAFIGMTEADWQKVLDPKTGF